MSAAAVLISLILIAMNTIPSFATFVFLVASVFLTIEIVKMAIANEKGKPKRIGIGFISSFGMALLLLFALGIVIPKSEIPQPEISTELEAVSEIESKIESKVESGVISEKEATVDTVTSLIESEKESKAVSSKFESKVIVSSKVESKVVSSEESKIESKNESKVESKVVSSKAESTITEEKDSKYVLDLNANIYGDVDTTGLKLRFGDLLNVKNCGDGLVVVKAKIKSSYNNKSTIDQNYYSVCDLIRENGFDACTEIQYWAVADMNDGSESKVISFTLNSETIQNVKNGIIIDNQLGNYVDDLYILPSLKN